MANKKSPYFKTEKTSYYLDILNMPVLPTSADDQYYVVEPRFEHRPDMLSQHFYNTPDYWFVFMLRNMDQFEDPIFDLVAGMEIRIPTQRCVQNLA